MRGGRRGRSQGGEERGRAPAREGTRGAGGGVRSRGLERRQPWRGRRGAGSRLPVRPGRASGSQARGSGLRAEVWGGGGGATVRKRVETPPFQIGEGGRRHWSCIDLKSGLRTVVDPSAQRHARQGPARRHTGAHLDTLRCTLQRDSDAPSLKIKKNDRQDGALQRAHRTKPAVKAELSSTRAAGAHTRRCPGLPTMAIVRQKTLKSVPELHCRPGWAPNLPALVAGMLGRDQ